MSQLKLVAMSHSGETFITETVSNVRWFHHKYTFPEVEEVSYPESEYLIYNQDFIVLNETYDSWLDVLIRVDSLTPRVTAKIPLSKRLAEAVLPEIQRKLATDGVLLPEQVALVKDLLLIPKVAEDTELVSSLSALLPD